MKKIVLPISGKNETYEVKPEKIIALGLNYTSHIKESESLKVKGFTNEVPQEPVLFTKTTNVLIGNDDDIVIPEFLQEYKFENPRVDYEAELAFIIKKQCKNVRIEDAYNYILGFTCMNDVSQRNIQNLDKSGWFRGKSFDTFGPIGPCLVLKEDIGDIQNLRIQCRLNGKTVQDANTNEMLFKIPEILSFVSKNFTLEKGDIILTGTPAGVGPMKHGDTVEVEIEKIGTLRNGVVSRK